ncbi:unnamed protein product [Chrysodeixis includens]|uniref:THAP-type domain-containing protein n=1 Tax=Chrysodeixis includens TaxID=689277 RepID=A0A9N8KVZ5_CHRIL|nr:unnamed protein product [Chrysodeixis includens]
MVSCSLAECPVTRTDNPNKYTFHRIPRSPAMRAKWVRIINRPDWTPTDNSYICSKHFEQRQFIQRKLYRVLMKEAIPTLFVPVHLPRTKPVSLNANKDITLSESSQSLVQRVHTPYRDSSTSNLKNSQWGKRAIQQNLLLKQKIEKQNHIIKKLRDKVKIMMKEISDLKEAAKDKPGDKHKNDIIIIYV